jgi:hypothetical protein
MLPAAAIDDELIKIAEERGMSYTLLFTGRFSIDIDLGNGLFVKGNDAKTTTWDGGNVELHYHLDDRKS